MIDPELQEQQAQDMTPAEFKRTSQYERAMHDSKILGRRVLARYPLNANEFAIWYVNDGEEPRYLVIGHKATATHKPPPAPPWWKSALIRFGLRKPDPWVPL